jgi:hypothetical protein
MGQYDECLPQLVEVLENCILNGLGSCSVILKPSYGVGASKDILATRLKRSYDDERKYNKTCLHCPSIFQKYNNY